MVTLFSKSMALELKADADDKLRAPAELHGKFKLVHSASHARFCPRTIYAPFAGRITLR